MNVQLIQEIYPYVLLHDFSRYFITAGLAYLFFWILGKGYWRERIIQNKIPNAKQKWKEFRYSMSTVFIFSCVGMSIVLLEKAAYTAIYEQVEDYGWGYLILSFGILLITHDIYFYVTHRLMHHPILFKHVHLVHHQSSTPSPWAAYSFHPWEAIIQAIFYILVVFLLPVHGVVLFVFVIYMIVRNVQGHLGIEFLPSFFVDHPWLFWFTTTTHHDLHHKYSNYNYGLYFTWMDDWFQTTHPEYKNTFKEVTSRRRGTIKKNMLSLVGFLFIFSLGYSQSPVGIWQTFDEETGLPLAKIEIELAKNRLIGKVHKIFDRPWEGNDPVCYKCPKQWKGKKVKEMALLWGFSPNGKNGKIIDPKKGKIYSAKMWLDGKTHLKVRAYASALGVIYQTQKWRRISQMDASNPFIGLWEMYDEQTNEKKAHIRIVLKNQQLKGQIIQLFPTVKRCVECKGKMKNQPIAGLRIIRGFKQEGDQWRNGRILDPTNGKIYQGTLQLSDENTLLVRGYWGPFYRTQKWKRIRE